MMAMAESNREEGGGRREEGEEVDARAGNCGAGEKNCLLMHLLLPPPPSPLPLLQCSTGRCH